MTLNDIEISFLPLEKKVLDVVSKTARDTNIHAYAIGGFVRDKILNRPTEDVDIVCIGDGISFARKTALQFKPAPKVHVFKSYGTAMFRIKGLDVEFVGARKESYQRHSRNPIVETGTLEDDQNRRDFTINALAINLNEQGSLNIIDPFNGLQDLNDKIIKTPLDPDITFSDDPLRMLRAVRFAAQLGFSIEKDTFDAIRRNASRIKIISMERISTELNKILLTKKPSVGLNYLFDSGILDYFFPELVKLQGIERRNGNSHKDNFYHTLEVVDNLARNSDDLWLRWAALLHDIAKPPTKRYDPKHGWTFHGHEVVGERMVPKIFRRLKLPMNEHLKFVKKMVLLHLRPISLSRENITDSAIRRLLFDAGDDLESLMLLCEADITSKNRVKVKRYLENFKLVREKLQQVEESDHIRNWQPPISGEDIMKTFNLKPCREVGIIKNAIKDAILDGVIKNENNAAFAFMMEKGKELGLKAKR